MTAFIDEHRDVYGVEPICRLLQIAPSTYYDHVAKRSDPDLRSNRAQRDEALCVEIRRIWEENFGVYGVRKVWQQLLREGYRVARCTVERLMRRLGFSGVVRGKGARTTISDKAQPCPQDKVNRQFRAERPNQLWIADFTYVSTWQGFVYVAFVVDVQPSVGSVGDSYDNAMAESIIDLFKTEVIERQSWQNLEAVEMATLNWQHWSLRNSRGGSVRAYGE